MEIKISNVVFQDWKKYSQNYWRNADNLTGVGLSYSVNSNGWYFEILPSFNNPNCLLLTINKNYRSIYGRKKYSNLELAKQEIDQFLIKISKLIIFG